MVGLLDSENEWDSTRSTCDSNGMTTMWVNGKRSDREILEHHSDRHSEYHSGSRLRLLWWRLQCKTDMTDVHLWDKDVSLCDVSSDMQGHSFTPGQLEKPAGPHKWHCVWT